MTPILHIPDLVDPAVLQHLQESFAAQKNLSLLLFNAQGEKLTKPSPYCLLTPELLPVLQLFVDFILNNPPHFADLGLKDGNTVFASFFSGIFHRAILPVMVQRQALGAVQLVAVHNLESFDLGRWRYILDGFTWNDVSYLAFLDSQPRAPLTDLVQNAALFRTHLTEMLESGFTRFKKQHSGTAASTRVGKGNRELVTNRLGDILSATSAMAELLHYESAAEMIGLNAIEHLTVDATLQEELHDRLTQGESESLADALTQTKDGLLLRVRWLILLEKDDEDHEVGLRWQIQRSAEARSDEPESAEPFPKRRAKEGPAAKPAVAPVEEPDQRDGEVAAADQADDASGAVAPEDLEFIERLPYPLFAIDSQNRILLWNSRLESLLNISARAMVGLDFSNLLFDDSCKQWKQWIFDLRINKDAKEAKPAGLLYALDNSGEVHALRLELSKTEIKHGQIISAIIRSCEKSAPPPRGPIDLKPRSEAWMDTGSKQLLPVAGSSPGALTVFARLLEKQWQPLHDQITQLVRSLEMGTSERDNARELLQDAEALTRLLQQARYVAGDISLNHAAVPFIRVLRYAANSQEPLFSRQNPVIWLIEDENLLVYGDTVQLYHALFYLLNYVRRNMEDDSPLRIRLKTANPPEGIEGPTGPTVLMEVGYTDRRSPWPEPEKWAQSHEAPGDLGLAAMLAIVHAHNGAIRVIPAQGEQRAFQIYLPQAPRAARSTGKSAAILVIDDEPGIVQMNTLMLEHAGYVVLSALSGAEGLRLLNEHQEGIGAVLLDWTLPDISCQEMAAAIARISTVPLILTSGFLPDTEIKGVIDKYKVVFLQKPYTLALLVHTVAGVLKGE